MRWERASGSKIFTSACDCKGSQTHLRQDIEHRRARKRCPQLRTWTPPWRRRCRASQWWFSPGRRPCRTMSRGAADGPRQTLKILGNSRHSFSRTKQRNPFMPRAFPHRSRGSAQMRPFHRCVSEKGASVSRLCREEGRLRSGLSAAVIAPREEVAVGVERHHDQACPRRSCTTFGVSSSPPSARRLMHRWHRNAAARVCRCISPARRHRRHRRAQASGSARAAADRCAE